MFLPTSLFARGPKGGKVFVSAFEKSAAPSYKKISPLPSSYRTVVQPPSFNPFLKSSSEAGIPNLKPFTTLPNPSQYLTNSVTSSLERKKYAQLFANPYGLIRPVTGLSGTGTLPSQIEEQRRYMEALSTGKEVQPLSPIEKAWLNNGGLTLYQSEEQLAEDCHRFYKGKGISYSYLLNEHEVIVYEFPTEIFYDVPYRGLVPLRPGDKYVIMYDVNIGKGRIVEKWIFENPSIFTLLSK